MKRWLLIGILLFGGCARRGEKGERGANGLPGLRGPGQIVNLSGLVIGDAFTVSDPRIAMATDINVYVTIGGVVTQIPIYLPLFGKTILYTLDTPCDIHIYNAQSCNAISYQIVLII